MADFYHDIKNWITGVVTGIEGDAGELGWMTQSKNTQLLKIGVGQAVVGSRPCIRPTMVAADAGNGAADQFVHMQAYSHANDDQTLFNHYLVCVSRDGSIWYKGPSDAWIGVDVDPVAGGAWFTQTDHIDSAVMNNRVFLVNSTGERRAIRGLTESVFGMDNPPAIGVAEATAAGLAGPYPIGEYIIYQTYYNPTLGVESNPSPMATVTTTAATSHIQITLSSPSANQIALYTHWRLYVQYTDTQAQAYVVYRPVSSTGVPLSAQDGAIPLATTDARIALTADELADLVIPVPLPGENNAIPETAQYLAVYGRRLFAADKRKIYWSKIDQPDAFPANNYEVLDTGDGDEITGLCANGDDMLVIFTTSAVFGLFGNDPQSWTLRMLDTTIGCVGHQSIIDVDGKIAWWSPQYGPVLMQETQIQKIGLEQLDRQTWDEGPSLMHSVKGGWDPMHEHLLWVLPATDDSTLYTRGFPYNYRVGSWISAEWELLPIGALATAFDQRGNQRLFASDRQCRVGYFDSRTNIEGIDPVAVADQEYVLSRAFTGTGAQITGYTDASGDPLFYTTTIGGDTIDWRDRQFTIIDSNKQVVFSGRVRSNSAFSVTFTKVDQVFDTTNGEAYTWYLGSPVVEIATRWTDAGEGFLRKRFDRLYAHVTSTDNTIPVVVEWQKDQEVARTILGTITPSAVEATTDATWSAAALTTVARDVKRLSIFKSMQSIRFVFRQVANVPMTLVKMAYTGRTLSDRYL